MIFYRNRFLKIRIINLALDLLLNNQMYKISLLILFLIMLGFSPVCNSQNTCSVDSLKNVLLTSELPTDKQAKILSKIADDYFILKQYPLAIDFHNQALIKFQETGNTIGQSKENFSIGQTYSAINNFSKTLEYYLNALNILENSTNDSLKNIIKYNIGVFYINIGKMDDALDYLLKTRTFFYNNQPDFNNELIKNYRQIGVVYGKLNILDSALIYFNKALLVFERDTAISKIELGGLLNNIGAIYHKQKDYTNAIINFSDALNIFNQYNNQRGIGISTFNIALINKEQKNYTKAINLFKSAGEYFQATNDLNSIKECYNNLSNIYDIKEDYKNAFRYFQLFSGLKDSIMDTDVLIKIANIETQLEIEKIEEKNRIKIQLLEHQRNLSNYRWYLFTGILIIILLIFSILLYKRNIQKKLIKVSLENTRLEKINLEQEKQHLKNELDFKTNELANFANYILNRNEILDKLKKEIKNLKNNPDKNIDKLARLVNQSLSFDKDRKELLIRVEQTHQSFFYKLQNKFPDLTDNEKRILALVMAELSTKEIASLLNISVGSVDMARYRLRKKMKIEPNQSIIDFLAGL